MQHKGFSLWLLDSSFFTIFYARYMRAVLPSESYFEARSMKSMMRGMKYEFPYLTINIKAVSPKLCSSSFSSKAQSGWPFSQACIKAVRRSSSVKPISNGARSSTDSLWPAAAAIMRAVRYSSHLELAHNGMRFWSVLTSFSWTAANHFSENKF